jgi:hypothetical protein
MATHEALLATRVRRAIGAALAGGALALAVPAGFAMADPPTGPGGVSDPTLADYTQKIRALADQYTQAAQSGNFNQQQFTDELNTVNNQMRDELLANMPTVLGGR